MAGRKEMEKVPPPPEGKGIEDSIFCPVTLEPYSRKDLKEEKFAIVYGCGHSVSQAGSKNVTSNCPTCREPIASVSRNFALDEACEVIAHLDAERKALTAELTLSRQTFVTLGAEHKDMTAKLASAETAAATMNEKLRASETKAAQLELKLAEVQKEKYQEHLNVVQARRELSELRAELGASEEEKRGLNRQLSRLHELENAVVHYKQLVQEAERILDKHIEKLSQAQGLDDNKHAATVRSPAPFPRAASLPVVLFPPDKTPALPSKKEVFDFFTAIKNNEPSVYLNMLRKTPALVAARIKNGRTPLIFAAGKHYLPNHQNNIKELIEKFCEMGADVNAQDNRGNTALHVAAKRNDSEGVRFLLAKGANRTILNRANQTPEAIAEAANFDPASVIVIKRLLNLPAPAPAPRTCVTRSRSCCPV